MLEAGRRVNTLHWLCLALICIAVSASTVAATTNPNRTQVGGLEIVDWTPVLLSMLTEVEGRDALLAKYKSSIVAPNSAYFALAYGGTDDSNLASYLNQTQASRASIRIFSRNAPGQIRTIVEHFKRVVPDFSLDGQIVIIPAPANAIGAWVRPMGNKDVVVLGLENLMNNGSPESLQPFLTHELTHLYHAQVNPQMREMTHALFIERKEVPLYQVLWLEGLATYTSLHVNPGAKVRDVFNEQTVTDVQQRWPQLKKDLLVRLEATDKKYLMDYVFEGNRGEGIPPRTAYYVGMRIAEKLAQTHTLDDLARLSDAALLQKVQSALESLE